eukprot:6283562-Prymnesium_polylepis.1
MQLPVYPRDKLSRRVHSSQPRQPSAEVWRRGAAGHGAAAARGDAAQPRGVRQEGLPTAAFALWGLRAAHRVDLVLLTWLIVREALPPARAAGDGRGVRLLDPANRECKLQSACQLSL